MPLGPGCPRKWHSLLPSNGLSSWLVFSYSFQLNQKYYLRLIVWGNKRVLRFAFFIHEFGVVYDFNTRVICATIKIFHNSYIINVLFTATELIECTQNGVTDICQVCAAGYIQPNNVTSLDMKRAKCFLKTSRHDKCTSGKNLTCL